MPEPLKPVSTAERVAAAEAAIAALADGFRDWAFADLARARGLFAQARGLPPGDAARSARFREIYRVAHDLKGQCGSFGYDLAGAIADQLCAGMRDAPGEAADPFVANHLAALDVVLRQGPQGPGGARGRAMLEKLAAIPSR